MILASKEISRRNGFPVYLRCELWGKDEGITRWSVERAGRVFYADTFEDAAEYIKKSKLLSAKRIEDIDSIKKDFLKKVEQELEKLQHIEDIKNTPEYRGAKAICKIRQQLRCDGVANSEKDANKLIELHYLKEMGENLFQIVQDLQDR